MEKFLNRLPKLTEKQGRMLELVSKYTFCLALFIELTIVILEKSEYIIQYEGLWFRLTFVLFGLSMITSKHSLRSWLCFILMSLMGVSSYFHTGRNEILRAVVMIWACEGKNIKKALKFTFWYTAAGCIIIVLLSIFGIYGEIGQTAVYRAEMNGFNAIEETRYCFGMGHPNAFHCMMLAITWIGVYCYYEKIKLYGYMLVGSAHFILYLLTDSRTGLLMSIGSLVIIMILQYWKKLRETKRTYIVGILGIVGCVILSVMFAVYCVNLPIFAKIDGMLSGRIFALMDSVNHDGMIQTWSLWSNPVNDNFFDLGIVRFFYWFGIIPGIIYFVAQCRLIWCGYKEKDYMLLAMVVVITIYSVFEAHFISDYMGRNYILLWFGMYLSQMLGVKQTGQLEENISM